MEKRAPSLVPIRSVSLTPFDLKSNAKTQTRNKEVKTPKMPQSVVVLQRHPCVGEITHFTGISDQADLIY